MNIRRASQQVTDDGSDEFQAVTDGPKVLRVKTPMQ
jgi:hypothetical protein